MLSLSKFVFSEYSKKKHVFWSFNLNNSEKHRLFFEDIFLGTLDTRVGVKYSTCTWYLYLSTYLLVPDVLEYLMYGNVKVLVLVLVLDQKVLGTWHVFSSTIY